MKQVIETTMTPANRKCLHCGVLFAVESGSQTRHCPDCEESERVRPRVQPVWHACEACDGRGGKWVKTKFDPRTATPVAEEPAPAAAPNRGGKR
jgi:hypothetical protein